MKNFNFENKIKMNSSDLYKSLILNISKKDLSVANKKDFINKIEKIDKDGQLLVYLLIKNYFINNNPEVNSASVIPYNGIKNNDKVEFNFLDFPNELKQLLYKFVILHMKKLEIDVEYQNNLSKHENN